MQTGLIVPAHVGIIMDGNGRWAKKRGMIRTQGHLEGLKAAKRVVKAAADLKISYLTLYTLSTENKKRPAEEIGFILSLVKQYLRGELNFYRENKIRIRHCGDRSGLPADILEELDSACAETRSFTGLQVILALNYGGRDEIIRAIARMNSKGIHNPTQQDLSSNLDNPDVPDPDLIIRTAGEFRTSNFLVWEGVYAEYLISDKLWPDWESDDLIHAVNEYKKRDRRYGGIAE